MKSADQPEAELATASGDLETAWVVCLCSALLWACKGFLESFSSVVYNMLSKKSTLRENRVSDPRAEARGGLCADALGGNERAQTFLRGLPSPLCPRKRSNGAVSCSPDHVVCSFSGTQLSLDQGVNILISLRTGNACDEM